MSEEKEIPVKEAAEVAAEVAAVVEVHDPVKRITRIALIVIAIVFVWYVAADRLAPWTDQARVQAYIVPIVSQVAGRVVEINVGKDQEVQQGDVLLKIDPADYQLAVENAETNLELAGQDIGARSEERRVGKEC